MRKNSFISSLIASLEAYWHNAILKTYLKNVDIFIAPSEFVRSKLVAFGIETNKVRVVPHFISQSEEGGDIGQEKSNFALYFGRISREKGLDTLIDIFQKIEGLTLKIAGSVEGSFPIKSNDHVEYLGRLEKNDLEALIKKSCFTVCASRLPETFGLMALESISQGKPFVGFKSGAFPEIIKNNENGVLVDTNEELAAAIRKIIGKEFVFDELSIRQKSSAEYNAGRYYLSFSKIAENLVEKKRVDKNTQIC